MTSPLFRAMNLRAIPEHLARSGVDPHRVLQRAGFRAHWETWDDLVVTQHQVGLLLSEASAALDDPLFPIRVGAASAEFFHPVRHAFSVARSLEHAFKGTDRVLGLVREGAHWRTKVHFERGVISQELDHGDGIERAMLATSGLAVARAMIRSYFDPGWKPLAVILPEGTPIPVGRLEEEFQAPVRLQGGSARFIVPAHVITRSWRPAVGDEFYRLPLAQEAFERLVRDDDALVEQLGHVIDSLMPEGALTVRAAAHTLGLSPRTLQSRLARFGAEFSDLIDTRRRTLAASYLVDTDLPATHIAMLLGYSESASFTRAFRRWYGGQPPQRYRRSRRDQATAA